MIKKCELYGEEMDVYHTRLYCNACSVAINRARGRMYAKERYNAWKYLSDEKQIELMKKATKKIFEEIEKEEKDE